jgi:type I restriction enzyme M protein
MKRHETNDIVQCLLPQLDKIGIKKEFCKIDVTTEKSGNKRGDIWISTSKYSEKAFEKNIICLIEAKHRKSNVGDMDWRDAMRQGTEKATKQNLNFYVITNCVSEVRFYNVYNDEEISLDDKLLNHFANIEILQKIGQQITAENSSVRYKTITLAKPFSESKFRNSLKNLSDIYRSAGIKNGDERIEPTISFVVLKYIEEYEKNDRKLNKVIKLWSDFRKIALEKETGDLRVEFEKMVEYIWHNERYKEHDYKDFKDLIKFHKNLKHEHFVKIYNELDQYNFHGANFDLFGAIYEEFASQTKKKEFGEFYTRRHITGVVARLLLRSEISPRELKICDPACGAGGFLTEGFKALVNNYSANSKLNEKVKKKLKEEFFWGFDNDDKSVARTKLNMFLVGDGHVHIYENDSLIDWSLQKGWGEEMFNYVLTNPPMGKYDGEASIENFDFTNERRMELLFTERVVKATQYGGEIAIVLNDGALETPSRKVFRKKLLEYCNIYSIISLTKFAFAPYTKEKTYVLFMSKKQENEIGEIQKFPIWHYILDYDGYANSDKRYKTKYHDDITELENLFPLAVLNAKNYITNKKLFEANKGDYERRINLREQEEGLVGFKFKYTDISEINNENYYNLISEFHLRPYELSQYNIAEFTGLASKVLEKKITLPKPKKISKEQIKTIFSFKGGNNGLTEEFVYHHQPNSEDEKIAILSSATIDDTQMGLVSKNAKIDGRSIKIFSGETILIARNGYAGSMKYFKNYSYTTNDHAYVMSVKSGWKSKINLRFIAFYFQPLFFNIVTSKSDNATFNKEYAELQTINLPDIKYQNAVGDLLIKLDEQKEKLELSLLEINKLKNCEVV